MNNSRTKNIVNHTVSSFFYKTGAVLANFALVPVIINYLNTENYGIWLTISSFIAWFSFFDIGLGMDPDATGRENVYLRSLFLPGHVSYSDAFVDDVLGFADLGEFAEMPIRTYSAGMVARLQFAITTAIRPDILLLDEGIGAGDAAFVQKAQIRLDEMMARSGILVLASHSEGLVRSMCKTALLMEKGEIVFSGDVDTVLEEYARRTAG